MSYPNAPYELPDWADQGWQREAAMPKPRRITQAEAARLQENLLDALDMIERQRAALASANKKIEEQSAMLKLAFGSVDGPAGLGGA